MLAVAVVTVLCGTPGMLCTVWAFGLFARGLYPSMVVVGGFAVFAFGLLAVRVIVAMGTVAPRVEYGDGATMLRPDPKVDRLSLTAVLVVFGAMLVCSVCAPLGMIEIPGLVGDQKWFVLACMAGVVIGLPSLWRIATHGGMSYLRMNATGFEFGDAYSRTERTWEELSEVSDVPRHKPWLLIAGSTYLTTFDGSTRTVASDCYTPGGHALRELVSFYWQHPECRDELTDGRAAQRLRDEL